MKHAHNILLQKYSHANIGIQAQSTKNRMQNKAVASNQQSLVLLCIIELAPNVKDETPKSFLKNKPPNT